MKVYHKIILILDNSDSTYNGDESFKNSEVINNTKEIHIAIKEACIELLKLFALNRDLTNVYLEIIVFGTNYGIVFNKILESSSELNMLITDKIIDEKIEEGKNRYTGSKALEKVVSNLELNNNSLIIIFSDGKPNNPKKTSKQLDNLIQTLNNKDYIYDIFTVGAGSIQTSENGSISNLYRRNEKLNITSLRNSYCRSECDLLYLYALSAIGNKGGYSGAYQDYKELINNFTLFMHNKKYGIILGCHILYYDTKIQEKINNNFNDDILFYKL